MKARLAIGFVFVTSMLLVSTWVSAAKMASSSVLLKQVDLSQPSQDWNNDASLFHSQNLSSDRRAQDTKALAKSISGAPGWEQVNVDGFGDPGTNVVASMVVFSDTLYAGAHNPNTGAQLWRADSMWTAVFTNGFGSVSNQGINHMIEFQSNLYAGTWANAIDGGEIWRSGDTLTWTRVVSQGFGDTTNTEIFRFAVFSDTLYASTWNRPNGSSIWYSNSGDGGNWTKANLSWDTKNIAATALDVFNGHLYAGTVNETDGGEMWRTSDGTTWSQTNIDGFGESENDAIASSAIFKGYLYAGTRNASAGGQVWRCSICNGSDWERIANDGFNNTDNWGALALIVFDDDLYSITGNDVMGVEVWRTGDGKNWEQVAANGFGDSGNYRPYWDNSAVVFDNGLHIGTYNNDSGGEVWRTTHRVFLPVTIKAD